MLRTFVQVNGISVVDARWRLLDTMETGRPFRGFAICFQDGAQKIHESLDSRTENKFQLGNRIHFARRLEPDSRFDDFPIQPLPCILNARYDALLFDCGIHCGAQNNQDSAPRKGC